MRLAPVFMASYTAAVPSKSSAFLAFSGKSDNTQRELAKTQLGVFLPAVESALSTPGGFLESCRIRRRHPMSPVGLRFVHRPLTASKPSESERERVAGRAEQIARFEVPLTTADSLDWRRPSKVTLIQKSGASPDAQVADPTYHIGTLAEGVDGALRPIFPNIPRARGLELVQRVSGGSPWRFYVPLTTGKTLTISAPVRALGPGMAEPIELPKLPKELVGRITTVAGRMRDEAQNVVASKVRPLRQRNPFELVDDLLHNVAQAPTPVQAHLKEPQKLGAGGLVSQVYTVVTPSSNAAGQEKRYVAVAFSFPNRRDPLEFQVSQWLIPPQGASSRVAAEAEYAAFVQNGGNLAGKRAAFITVRPPEETSDDELVPPRERALITKVASPRKIFHAEGDSSGEGVVGEVNGLTWREFKAKLDQAARQS